MNFETWNRWWTFLYTNQIFFSLNLLIVAILFYRSPIVIHNIQRRIYNTVEYLFVLIFCLVSTCLFLWISFLYENSYSGNLKITSDKLYQQLKEKLSFRKRYLSLRDSNPSSSRKLSRAVPWLILWSESSILNKF